MKCTKVNMSRFGRCWNSHCVHPDWVLGVLFISADESHRTREGGGVPTVVTEKMQVWDSGCLRSCVEMSLKVEVQKVSSTAFANKFGQFKIHYGIIDGCGMIDIFIVQSHSVMVDVGTNDITGRVDDDVIQILFIVVGVFNGFRRDVTDLYAVALIGRKFRVVPWIFSKLVVF
jgi:hypothetical protein